MTKLAIGIPSGDMVHTDFAMSLTSMIAFTLMNCKDLEIVGVINEKTSLVHKSRNSIVRQAEALGANKLLFLDSDMAFPIDLIKELLYSGEKIIGCDYMRRRPPYHSLAKDKDGKPFPIDMQGVREAKEIGTGCLLIDMSVFAKLSKPYFDTEYDPASDDFISEDYKFCAKARLAGYQIWCDLDLSNIIGHCGQTIINKGAFLRMAKK